jgi:carbon-monoxide dehydrogenase medium subunit
VKPAPFAYVRAHGVAEVIDHLDAHGGEARLLAGGQSLIATLALRLSAPALLIDINHLHTLRFVELRGGMVAIGALTRYCDIEGDAVIAQYAPLLAQAIPHIAHPAIRNRGTVGGSLAFADPAAELPACMVALAATIVVAGRAGERHIAADDFFQGMYATALGAGEMLVRVEIPAAEPGMRVRLAEFSRRQGDYAIVGLAASGRVRPAGGFESLSLVFFGCGQRPVRARRVEALALAQGQLPSYARLREAMAADLNPQSDLQAGPDTRRHLAAVLAERTLAALDAK